MSIINFLKDHSFINKNHKKLNQPLTLEDKTKRIINKIAGFKNNGGRTASILKDLDLSINSVEDLITLLNSIDKKCTHEINELTSSGNVSTKNTSTRELYDFVKETLAEVSEAKDVNLSSSKIS